MQWLYFFGRFHPLVVHLPIGFLLVAFALELAGRKEKYRHLSGSVSFVLLLSAVGAAITALLGYFLSLEGGYEGEDLALHKWTGIAVTVMSIALYWVKVRCLQKVYLPLFTATIAVLMFAGHFGGVLTHGNDYLTEQAPESLKHLIGRETGLPAEEIDLETLDSLSMYAAIVNPILADKCVGCHRPGKMKGELRLDTPEAILKGGEGGQVLVAGNVEKSELIRRIHLPGDHDDHMPPEGKKQLARAEIILLEWWIAEGGDFEKKVGQCQQGEEIRQILEKRFAPKVSNPVYALPVDPASEKRLGELREAGLIARPLARQSPFLEINLSNADSLTSGQLALLKKIGDNLVRLDLANSNADDEMLVVIRDLPHLTHLHLNGTRITDQGLQHLQGLQYLEYLNLYNTAVTDEGLNGLLSLPRLRQLYLWQTAVSEDGIERLRRELPEVLVDFGLVMQVDTAKNTAVD